MTRRYRGGVPRLPDRLRNTVMGLTPVAAIALFLLTRSWTWFLFVPVIGILLYGPRRQRRR